MKNILIVSDSFTNGGLETRIKEEIIEYKKHHFKVYLACKNLNEDYRNCFEQILLLPDLPYSSNDNLHAENLLLTRDRIVSFCKKYSIDYIECQPFWCSLPAALAAEKLSIPISFTLHGTISGNFIGTSYPGLNLVYYLTFKYGFDQIFGVAEYLKNMYSYLSPNIIVARNGINFGTSNPITKSKKTTGHFCIVSRIDALKIKPILDFLPQLHECPLVKKIDIIGDGDSLEKLQDFITQKDLYKAHLVGWKNDILKTILTKNYDAVFGMGRVVLDAVCANTPIGILGYGGFAGFLNHQNLKYFAGNNLTDWEIYNDISINHQIESIYKNPSRFLFSQKDISLFDNKAIWQAYFKTEAKIKYSKKPFLELLNSEIEKSSTPLLSIPDLIAKNHHPIIKNDYIYQSYCAFLSTSIENEKLKATLYEITNSKLWKTTKPLRKILSKKH